MNDDKIDSTPKPEKFDVSPTPPLPPLAPKAPESSSVTLANLHDRQIDEMNVSYARMNEGLRLAPTDLSGVPTPFAPFSPAPAPSPPLSPAPSAANVTPIHPGMPIGGPRLDPMTEMLQSMGISFEALTQDRASAKGRAWDLVCACARRAPVDEETVRQSLKLSLLFEEEWKKHEKLEEQARAIAAAETSHLPPTFPGAGR